ncbi:MAG: hypothetical protein MUC63_06390 [Planctomycetes bacterium]|nr:hypothetical protein [Planctomycetota bacterium]
MSDRVVRILAAFLLLGGTGYALEEPPASVEPVPAGEDKVPEAQLLEIRGWIAKLGAEEWGARQQAEEALLKAGVAARGELETILASSPDEEVKQRALRVLETLGRTPSETDLLKLAGALEAILREEPTQEKAGVRIRKLLSDFRARFAPKEGVAAWCTKDRATVAVCLGAAADPQKDGVGAVLETPARWVISIGGQGLDFNIDGLPGADDTVPDSNPGKAVARAPKGIAIALGGDGLLLRVGESGIAGGGCGGDAEAVSPAFGLALGGLDRTGSTEPPMHGEAMGSGSLEKAKELLGAKPEKK